MRRKETITTGEVYHIFSRSIAEYQIFNTETDFERITQLFKYYQIENEMRFSFFRDLVWVKKNGFNKSIEQISEDKDELVQIIAYCLMPTHIHLILKQLKANGISNYMRKVLDGYSRYFNLTHKRKGPLWESKFQNVLVVTDKQLLHLTRYLHLNPVTTHLIDKPEDWAFSSYNEYLGEIKDSRTLCQFDDVLEIKPSIYRKFVNDQISYQRELAKIKKLMID